MALRCNIALDDRFIPSTILTATSAVCRYFRFPIPVPCASPNASVSWPNSFFGSLQRPHSFWTNGRLCPLGAFCYYSPSPQSSRLSCLLAGSFPPFGKRFHSLPSWLFFFFTQFFLFRYFISAPTTLSAGQICMQKIFCPSPTTSRLFCLGGKTFEVKMINIFVKILWFFLPFFPMILIPYA